MKVLRDEKETLLKEKKILENEKADKIKEIDRLKEK
jgi:hypothetical protein